MAYNENIGRNLTEGSIFRLLITFSLPLLLGNILQLLQQTINAFWIGRFLDKSAFSAVTVSFPIIFILISFIMGITLAATSLVAQYTGAKKPEMVEKVIENSFAFISILALIISTVGVIFNKAILRLAVNPAEMPDVFELASGYLIVSLIGIIFMFGFNLTTSILRGLGDSWMPLWFLIGATILNAVLDPILILGIGIIPRMGIKGSALATIIAQFTAFILGVVYLKSKGFFKNIKFKNFTFDFELIRKFLKIGLPTSIQQIIVSTGVFIITIIVSQFGVNAISAFGVGSRIDGFSFMPSMAIGMAVTALTGQNLGAGKKDRVKATVRVATLLSISISAAIILICFLFPSQIIRFFLSNPSMAEAELADIIRQGTLYLQIVSIGYIGVSLIFVTNGALQGAGDTLPTMLIAILSFWLLRIPISWILSQYTPFGSTGIWLGISIGFIFSAILSRLYYQFGHWENKIAINHK